MQDGENRMMMTTIPLEEATDPLDALTPKQREVLDLLIEHKTSKQISRQLGISPHTVDQRIMLARAKLNVATRSEVALQYRRLIEDRRESAIPAMAGIWEKPIYDLSHVDMTDSVVHGAEQEDDVLTRVAIDRFRQPEQQTMAAASGYGQAVYHGVLPEMFDGQNGTMVRLGAIAVITVVLILIILGGLAMFAQLSQIIGH